VVGAEGVLFSFFSESSGCGVLWFCLFCLREFGGCFVVVFFVFFGQLLRSLFGFFVRGCWFVAFFFFLFLLGVVGVWALARAPAAVGRV